MLVPSRSMREFLETAAGAYATQLPGTEAQEYLAERGITKPAVDFFRLGFVGEPASGHELYKGRVSFPYITRSGVTSIRFRRVGDDPNQAKMLYVPGDSPRIYNTVALLSEDVIICEGEIDTITATICGYDAVGIPGAKAWSKFFTPAFRYRSVKVVAHNDDSGEGLDFAKMVARDLEDCRIVLCPPGMDLNKLYVSDGEEAVKELIR